MVDKITSIENITNKAQTPEAATSRRRTAWSWVKASPFRCPRCGTITLTREAGARCPCGYKETAT